MADLSSKITVFENAVYGRDVKAAFVDLATTINDDYNSILTQYSTFAANMTYLMELAERLEGKKILDVE